MTNQTTPRAGFELDLLDQLKLFVAARGATLESEQATAFRGPATRQLAPRLALGGAVASAAVAAVLAISAGSDSTPSAYAVETQDGGGLIEIHSLNDAAGLEGALEKAGVPSQVTWLAAGMTCREPHFKSSAVNVPMPDGASTRFDGFDVTQVNHLLGEQGTDGPASPPLTVGIGNLGQREAMERDVAQGKIAAEDAPQFTIDPTAFAADQTLVLSGSQVPYDGDPEGGSAAHVRIAEGDVGPCEPVPAGSPAPSPADGPRSPERLGKFAGTLGRLPLQS